MKVPRYKMSGGGAVTIGAFKYCNVVLPVTMLKEHIESADAIRTTPEDAERDGPSDRQSAGGTAPASCNGKVTRSSAVATHNAASDEHDSTVVVNDENQDVSHSITDIEDFGEVTTLECEQL
jgi:hypothetical protein